MKIIIARHPSAIDYIEPHLLDDPDYAPGDLAEMLRGAVRSENMFLSLVVDGEDLKAFLIAFSPSLQNHAFIYQAWSDPEFTDQHYKDSVFLRLILWSEAKGLGEIRAETKRSTKPFLRRWNFTPYSTIMTYVIPENFEEELLRDRHDVLLGKSPQPAEASPAGDADPSKEITNGRQQQTKINTSQQTISTPKSSGRVDAGRSPTSDRPRPDTTTPVRPDFQPARKRSNDRPAV